jgi:hypothetical protein
MHAVGGNLKEVLLEYDGKSYRKFLVLLGEDVKLPPPQKKERYLCTGMGGRYL